MDDQQTQQPTDGRPSGLAQADGSAADDTILDMRGRPIRRLDANRWLKQGDRLCNKYGQKLWEVEGCCARGFRVSEWPTGRLIDFEWCQLTSFWERVDDAQQNTKDEPRGQRE